MLVKKHKMAAAVCSEIKLAYFSQGHLANKYEHCTLF